MLAAGDLLTLRIEKPAAGGRMIARSESGIVLVSGTIPGEQVSARIERVVKGVAFAETIQVEEPSLDRREPFNDPLCGGCLYAHIDYRRQLAIKEQIVGDAFLRIGHIPLAAPVTVLPSETDGYRMRARLHARNGQVGFFREGSHQLCEPRPTRQLLAETCDVLDQLGDRLRSVQAHVVGEIELSENSDASQRVVHLETAGEASLAAFGRLGQISGVTGLTVSPATVLSGDPHVVDTIEIGGHQVAFRRHVLAFFQGNRFLLRDLVSQVIDCIEIDDDVVDLYAGAGLFSIAAAVVRGASVTAVEGDHAAAADLETNASVLGGAVRAVHQPVETFVAAHRPPPSVMIVDPPRTGMSKEAIAGAIALHPRTIVYVSCDVATLARDSRRLLDAGYLLADLRAFDLFPNTPHVECVGRFRRT